MLKWCVMDDCTEKRACAWLTPHESKEEAMKAARDEWDRTTESDKLQRDFFGVILCNVDESGNYVETETGEIDADWYEIAAEFTA